MCQLSYTEANLEARRKRHLAKAESSQDVLSDDTFRAMIEGGPADLSRRSEAASDLYAFGRYYFSEAMTREPAPFHRPLAETMQEVVDTGGRYAFAFPRGSAKTLWARVAIMWTVLNKPRQFATLYGDNLKASKRLIKSTKVKLLTSDLLWKDYPEICCAIRHSKGESRKMTQQKLDGVQCRMTWDAEQIGLPWSEIEYAVGRGNQLLCGGLTGGIRGPQVDMPDGFVLRPTVAFLDDVQNRESAKSFSQTEDREALILGDVAGLAGPDDAIGLLYAGSILFGGDLTDRFTNGKDHPDWKATKVSMLETEPDDMEIWHRYWELRCSSIQAGLEFYEANRDNMDAGASVSWPDRYSEKKGEVSGIQAAMNFLLADAVSFQSEYQAAPIVLADEASLPEAEDVRHRVSGLDRAVVPESATMVNAAVDISGDVIWWQVEAASSNTDRHVIDYGEFPKQGLSYFTLQTLKVTLSQVASEHLSQPPTQESAVIWGLRRLLDDLRSRKYFKTSGTEYKLGRVGVDIAWGPLADAVYDFLEAYGAADVIPCRGIGIKAGDIPLAERRRFPGETKGDFWRIRPPEGRKQSQLQVDVNEWKARTHKALTVDEGNPGRLVLFGKRQKTFPDRATVDHKVWSQQVVSESRVKTEGRGRSVWEYRQVGGRDNHYLDCSSLLGAIHSSLGISPVASEVMPEQQKPKSRGSLIESARRNGLRIGKPVKLGGG